jgi:hypothetical protein
MTGDVGRRIMREEYIRWGGRPREKVDNSVQFNRLREQSTVVLQHPNKYFQSKLIIRTDSPSIENGEKQIAKTTLINR